MFTTGFSRQVTTSETYLDIRAFFQNDLIAHPSGDSIG